VSGEVVGLVHRGANCRIATQGDRFARLIDRVLKRERTRVPGCQSGPGVC